MKEKINFSDLNLWIKIAIIGGILEMISWIYFFILGLIEAI